MLKTLIISFFHLIPLSFSIYYWYVFHIEKKLSSAAYFTDYRTYKPEELLLFILSTRDVGSLDSWLFTLFLEKQSETSSQLLPLWIGRCKAPSKTNTIYLK